MSEDVAETTFVDSESQIWPQPLERIGYQLMVDSLYGGTYD